MTNATRTYANLMLALPEPTTCAPDPRDNPSSPAEWAEGYLLCHALPCSRRIDRGVHCASHAR